MESTWQVSTNKKKHSKTPVSDVPMSNIKILTDEVILSYKSVYVTVSCALSKKFDDINKMFSTSTQYLDSKEKINHNQHNHNKWQTKKDSDYDDIEMILGNFNKLSINTFDLIAEEIKKYNIITFADMIAVVKGIYSKCISDKQFVQINCKLIKKIMMEFKWIVYDDANMPVTFRKCFVNFLEEKFKSVMSEIIDDTDMDEKEENFLRERRKTYFSLLSALFSESIIGNQLFRFIFNNIENAFLNTLNDEYMDRWLLLYDCAKKYWIDSDFKYIQEKQQFITDNKDKFSIRISIMIEKFVTDNGTMVIEDVEENNIYVVKESVAIAPKCDYDIEMLICSLEEYSSITQWWKYILEIKNDYVIGEIINALTCRVNNVRQSFTIMAFLIKKDPIYEKLIVEKLKISMGKSKNKSFVNNAKKIIANN